MKRSISASVLLRASLAALPMAVGALSCGAPPEPHGEYGVVISKEFRPLDADPRSLAQLGHEALETLGYEEIIERARQAGFVTTIPVERSRSNRSAAGNLLGTAEDAAVKFVEVYSKIAVAAGVTSQLDTPLPGPADGIALGMLVLGLFGAGVLAASELVKPATFDLSDTDTTIEFPPVGPALTASASPSSEPKPQPTPQPPQKTGPSSPIPLPYCPRNESFIPIHTDNATGCIAKNGHLRCYSRRHDPCAGVHTHGRIRYQEIRNGICKSVEDKAVRCEGPFIISGSCGSVPTVECKTGGPEVSGIHEGR